MDIAAATGELRSEPVGACDDGRDCRMHGVSFAAAVRDNLFGIVAGEVHPELAGMQPSDWLPGNPTSDLRAADSRVGRSADEATYPRTKS